MTAYLGLAIGEDGALRVGAAQRVEDGHERLVLRLLVEFEVDHRLRKLHHICRHISHITFATAYPLPHVPLRLHRLQKAIAATDQV